MHPCLELEEILIPICREITGDENTKRFRQTLLSFACSRKIFSPPALARLWQEINDLGPLLSLLPTSINPDKSRTSLSNDPDVLMFTTWMDHVLPEYVLHCPIEKEHWKRLDRYTRYVRRLILTTRGFDRLLGRSDQEKFTDAINTREAPLLPNLSHISILSSSAYADGFPSPRLLIPLAGTALRSLTLSGRAPSTMSVSAAYPLLVSALSVKYSQIKDLSIDLYDFPSPADSLLHNPISRAHSIFSYGYALSQFARIHSLTLPWLHGGMLAPLAALTHLTRLHIGNCDGNDEEASVNAFTDSSTPRCLIPTLRVLELKSGDFNAAAATFRMFTGLSSLCHVIVPVHERTGEDKWPGFIAQVERLFAAAADATLLLTWNYHRIGDSTMRSGTFPNEAFDFMHTRATTAPMHITCRGNIPSSVTHSLAEDIAHGRWTHLRTLRFEVEMDSLSLAQLDVPPNLLNLDDLRLLVDSCPSLEELLTPIRALWIPHTPAADIDYQGTNPPRTGLRLVVVGWYSPIEQINGVAEYLSAILPQLRLTLDTVPRCVRDRKSLGGEFVDRALGWNSRWDEVITALNRAKAR